MGISKNLVLISFLFVSYSVARADLLDDFLDRLEKAPAEDQLEVITKLQRYWQTVPVDLNGRLSKSVTMADHFEFGMGLGVDRRVEPSFVKDFHQRYDSYFLKPRLGSTNFSYGASAEAGVAVTFSRPFQNKKQAVLAPAPIDYLKIFNRQEWNVKFPWRAEQARDANVLAAGQAVRLEISSEGALGLGNDNTSSHFRMGVGGGVSRGTRVLVDIYKINDKSVRMRLLTSRNTATLSASADVSSVNLFSGGLRLLARGLDHLTKISPLNVTASKNLLDSTPVQTYMADYVLNLTPLADGSPSLGAKAYDSMMANVRSVFSFSTLMNELNFLSRSEKVSDRLDQYVKFADQAARYGRSVEARDRSVSRVFKGHTESRFLTGAIGSDLSIVAEGRQSQYSSQTNVRSYNADDVASEYLYISGIAEKKVELLKFVPSFGFDLDILDRQASVRFSGVNGRDQVSMNAIYDAKVSDRERFKLSPIRNGLAGLVAAREFTDANISQIDIVKRTKNLEYLMKPVLDRKPVDWKSIRGARTNAYFRLVFEFHREALMQLRANPNLTVAFLEKSLTSYIENYPRPDDLTYDAANKPGNDQAMFSRAEQEAHALSQNLYRALNNENPDVCLEQFKALRDDSVFQEIGAGYILSLLASQSGVELEKLVNVRLAVGSVEGAMTPSYRFGEKEISKDYKDVEYILNVINDRSFDLRVQMDSDGNLVRPAKQYDLEKVGSRY